VSKCTYIIGDTRDVVAGMLDGSVDLIVTSPPFLALRSYLPDGHPDKWREIGSEAGPADFLATLLDLTIEWRRVLAPHGSLCVELGDTFSGSGGGDRPVKASPDAASHRDMGVAIAGGPGWPLAKSMCGIPTLYTWSLAYGRNLLRPEQTFEPWRIRNLLVWARNNPPVGTLGDKFRPATSYITVACPSAQRWFDLDAVRTESSYSRTPSQRVTAPGQRPRLVADTVNPAGAPPLDWHAEHLDGPNGDQLWWLNTAPYPGSHYATYPPELPARLIQAMCPREVCTACGASRRRTGVTTEYVDGKGRPVEAQKWASGVKGGGGAHTAKPDGRYTSVRLGGEWTDCGCGAPWRNGIVLDPFGGSGTTGLAASGHGRDSILIDIDARNADLARERVGMFLEVDDRRPTEGAA